MIWFLNFNISESWLHLNFLSWNDFNILSSSNNKTCYYKLWRKLTLCWKHLFKQAPHQRCSVGLNSIGTIVLPYRNHLTDSLKWNQITQSVTKTLLQTLYTLVFFHVAVPPQCAEKTVIAASPCLFETSDLSPFSNALSAITYSSSVYASTVTRCF